MSLGIFSGSGAMGVLGAVKSAPKKTTPKKKVRAKSSLHGGLGAVTIPWQCWDKPGFKNCQAQMYDVAKQRCASGQSVYSSGSDCLAIEHNELTYWGCGERICSEYMPKISAPKTIGGWTFGNKTPNPEVAKLQAQLNVLLKKYGFKPIGEDGKLGPATCGAFKYLGNTLPAAEFKFPGVPVENMLVCSAWTNPTKTGGSTPESDPKSELAAKLDDMYGQLPWNTPDSRVVALQQSLNDQLGKHGFLPIPVTGMLDAQTCGAMRWLDSNTGSEWIASWGKGCKTFIDPMKPTVPQPAPQPEPPAPVPYVEPPSPEPVKPTYTGASMLGGLAIAGVIGTGIYFLGKKKGWFG